LLIKFKKMTERNIVNQLLDENLIEATECIEPLSSTSLTERFHCDQFTKHGHGMYIFQDLQDVNNSIKYIIRPDNIVEFTKRYLKMSLPKNLVYSLVDSVLHKLVFDIDFEGGIDSRDETIKNHLVNHFGPLIHKELFPEKMKKEDICPLVGIVYTRQHGSGIHVIFPDCVISHDDYTVLCYELNKKLQNDQIMQDSQYKIDTPNTWLMPDSRKPNFETYGPFGFLYIFPKYGNLKSQIFFESTLEMSGSIDKLLEKKNKYTPKKPSIFWKALADHKTSNLNRLISFYSIPYPLLNLSSYSIYHYKTPIYSDSDSPQNNALECFGCITISEFDAAESRFIYKDSTSLMLMNDKNMKLYPPLYQYVLHTSSKILDIAENNILYHMLKSWCDFFFDPTALDNEDQIINQTKIFQPKRNIGKSIGNKFNESQEQQNKVEDNYSLESIKKVCGIIRRQIKNEIKQSLTLCLIFNNCAYLPALYYIIYKESNCNNPYTLSKYLLDVIIPKEYQNSIVIDILTRLGKYRNAVIKDMSATFNYQNLTYIMYMIDLEINSKHQSSSTHGKSIREPLIDSKYHFLNEYILKRFTSDIISSQTEEEITDYYRITKKIASTICPVILDQSENSFTWYWKLGCFKSKQKNDPCIYMSILCDICTYLNTDFNTINYQTVIARLKNTFQNKTMEIDRRPQSSGVNYWCLRFGSNTFDLLANRLVKGIPGYHCSFEYDMETLNMSDVYFNQALSSTVLPSLFHTLNNKEFFHKYLKKLLSTEKRYDKFLKQLATVYETDSAQTTKSTKETPATDIKIDNLENETIEPVVSDQVDDLNLIQSIHESDDNNDEDIADGSLTNSNSQELFENENISVMDDEIVLDKQSDSSENEQVATTIPPVIPAVQSSLNKKETITNFLNFLKQKHHDKYVSALIKTLQTESDIFDLFYKDLVDLELKYNSQSKMLNSDMIKSDYVEWNHDYRKKLESIFQEIILFQVMIYQIMNFDYEKINFFIHILSSMIVAPNYYRQLIIFFGITRNGKSMILNLLSTLFNQYYRTADTSNLTINKKSSTQSDIFHAYFCRILVFEEMSSEVVDDQKIRTLTGNSTYASRQLYKNYHQGIVSAKTIATTNSKIKFKKYDEAIEERLLPIDFQSTFLDDNVPASIYKQMKTKTFLAKQKSELASNNTGFLFSLLYCYSKNTDFSNGCLNLPSMPDTIHQFKKNYISLMDDYSQFKLEYDVAIVYGESTTEQHLRAAIHQFLKSKKKLQTVSIFDLKKKFDKEFAKHKVVDESLSIPLIDDQDDEEDGGMEASDLLREDNMAEYSGSGTLKRKRKATKSKNRNKRKKIIVHTYNNISIRTVITGR
jgi:hypothetical protein